jgi:glycosyltransferase involved in cell wall biosynthesis
MSGTPRVSVVIKSYNHEAFVAQTIHSILTQSFQDFEIVITDDASIDATVEVIRTFQDSRIDLVVSPKNRGISNAMNATIARARGDYIAILNSDDYALPGRLQKQVAFLDSHPDIAVVFGLPRTVDDCGQPTASYFDFQQALELPDFCRKTWLRQFFVLGSVLCAPTAMVRRSAYAAVGRYDPRLTVLQDLDIWFRFCLGHNMHVMSDEVTAFRIRSNNQNMSAPRPDTHARSQFEHAQIMRKYRNLDPLVLREAFADDLAARQLPPDLPPDRLLFELALTLPSPAHQLFALETLFESAETDADYDRLREVSGSIDVFGLHAMRERDSRLRWLYEASGVAKQREEILQGLLNSPAWRHTAPLRWLKKRLRG